MTWESIAEGEADFVATFGVNKTQFTGPSGLLDTVLVYYTIYTGSWPLSQRRMY